MANFYFWPRPLSECARKQTFSISQVLHLRYFKIKAKWSRIAAVTVDSNSSSDDTVDLFNASSYHNAFADVVHFRYFGGPYGELQLYR